MPPASPDPVPIDPLPADWETDRLPPSVRVLVVDDNRDAADAVAALMRLCGADAVACYDGVTALAEAAARRPDACVIDLTMPGMDGCEVARRVRAAPGGEAVLLVALTGLGDIDALARTAGAGFDADFTKPADPGQLLPLIAGHAVRTGGSGRRAGG